MSAQDEFRDLIEKARQGCQESIRILVEQYREHVIRVIRRHLDKRVRSKLDSIDIAQLVWETLLCGDSLQKKFDDPAHFIAYLTGIARHKTLKENRHFLDSEKTSVLRECRIDAAAGEQTDGANRARSPGGSAIDEEEWQDRLAHLPRQVQRALTMIRAGSSLGDIAALLGASERTIQRMIIRLRQRTGVPDSLSQSDASG